MTIELLAPAKINLGLEILRKRADGFHDIATVFQTVSVFDRLRFLPSDGDEVQIVNRIVQIDANLAETALGLLDQIGIARDRYRVAIEKRIPVSAGLGGASTDAAAVLRALWPGGSAAPAHMTEVALRLGSDVPFLLHGGAALASGRGELLEPLPFLRNCWFVLACPDIELEHKTGRLYGALSTADFTDGDRARRVAVSLQSGSIPASTDLANTFSRPLAEVLPAVSRLTAAFQRAGAPFVALSGAGPSHYTIVPTLADAVTLSKRLAVDPPMPMRVLIARPTANGPMIRRDKTAISGHALENMQPGAPTADAPPNR